jgi:peptide/nickel transport system substrate-binding protein
MMRPASWSAKLVCLVVVAVLASACAQPSLSDRSPESERSPAKERPTLTLAIPREPSVLNWSLLIASESSNGLTLIKQIPHDQLMVQNDRGVWIPRLAAERISVDGGTWRVQPDGSMETIWKLREHIRWQDGTLFTANDLLFSFTVYKDPELAGKEQRVLQFMESASAPDPQTFVIRWSQTFRWADQLGREIDPLPRHLFEPLYLTDKASLRDSPLLGEGFVGLGPYQLTQWERGSFMEFAPFDDYYLGRPAFGKVLVRIIPDVNASVASVLAGAVDALVNIELSMDTAVELQARWQGTGNQVQIVTKDSPFHLEMQRRPDISRPVNGLTNRTVRQALLHGMDRQSIVDSQTAGLGQIADSWIGPNDELRSQLVSSIPQYPYDPVLAQRLLAEAGWVRGAGGVLRHQTSGDAFAVEARADVDTDSDKLMAVIADNWSALGVQATLTKLTPALKNDNEFRAKFSGVHGRASGSFPESLFSQFHSRTQASAETRWLGGRTGYSNPRVDQLLDRYPVTVEPHAQLALEKDLLQEMIGDLGFVPLYWPVEPVVVVKGVSGAKGRDAWNFHEWTKS